MTAQDKVVKSKRILIKIGTATITKVQKLNLDWIKQKTKEIAKLRNEGKEIIIVSSGAVGAGMEVEGLNKRPKDTLNLQLLSGKGQVRLMNIYKDFFNGHNIQVAQVLLTHHNFDTKEEVKNIKDVINSYVSEGTIPIINTNDVVTNEEVMVNSENKISDNDGLAALVAGNLGVDLLLILTDVDGLCTKDPRKNKSYMLVKLVEKMTKKVEEMASEEGSMMGTGGMLSKVIAAKKVKEKGVITIIANGKYRIEDVLNNKVDRTLFL